jgi:hypothetical protein
MDVELPNGTVVEGVPDGTTRQQMAQRLKAGGQQVPDDWLKPQAPKRKDFITEAAGAVVEPVLGAAGGFAGSIAGPAAGLMTAPARWMGLTQKGPEEVQKSVEEALRPEPKTVAGASPYNPLNFIPRAIGMPFEKLAGGAQKMLPPVSGEEAGKFWPEVRAGAGRGLAEAVRQLPNLLGAKFGKMAEARLPEIRAGLETEKSLAAPGNVIRDQAQAAGYKTPPETGVKAAAAGITGKAKVEKIISAQNADNASRRFAKEVGMPEDMPLTRENIQNRIEAAYAGRQEMEAAIGPKLKMTDNFKSAMEGTLAKITEQIEHNPEVNRDLRTPQRLIRTYLKKMEPIEVPAGKIVDEKGRPLIPATQVARDAAMTTSEVSHDISKLRQQASKDFQELNPELGYSRLGIANQLEGLFEENLAKAPKGQALVDKFRADRVLQAKLHFMDRVVTPDGTVDLAKVASLSETKAYKTALTGELKAAADFAKTYRKAAQKPTGESAPRLTVLDGLFAVGAFTAGHPMAAAAEIGGRLAVPALAERGLLQNRTPPYLPNIWQRGLPFAAPGVGVMAGQQDRQ